MAQAPIKFYYDLLSQPSRALYIFMRLTNIPFEENPIALRKGVHLADEYRDNVNRFKKVPAIVDNGFQLSESVAIFRYLASRFDDQIHDQWYPKNHQVRGRIDEYLEWQHLNIRQTCSQYFILKYLKPQMLGQSKESNAEDDVADDNVFIESAVRQMDRTLDKFENLWLKPGRFISGTNKISFADILAAAELEQPRIAGYDPAHGRPNIDEWMKLVRELTNPIYDEAHAIAYKITKNE